MQQLRPPTHLCDVFLASTVPGSLPPLKLSVAIRMLTSASEPLGSGESISSRNAQKAPRDRAGSKVQVLVLLMRRQAAAAAALDKRGTEVVGGIPAGCWPESLAEQRLFARACEHSDGHRELERWQTPGDSGGKENVAEMSWWMELLHAIKRTPQTANLVTNQSSAQHNYLEIKREFV
ncbi:hypothetical protein SLEP1_g49327 [Rubroshorea leprosula]|uniref:Uncharacterized protein n=1 Tax=Rubroshorea leprosula TaxID=152421 RepID=A0AAV5LYX5_9ROSI|nr:hypothetical protein SLEP1_g49327 [Rubroshorea leprosula]